MLPIPSSKIPDREADNEGTSKENADPHSLQKAHWAAHSRLLNSWILTGSFLSEVNGTSAISVPADPMRQKEWRTLPNISTSQPFTAALIDRHPPQKKRKKRKNFLLLTLLTGLNCCCLSELSAEVLFAELQYVLQHFGPVHLTKQFPQEFNWWANTQHVGNGRGTLAVCANIYPVIKWGACI